MFVFSSVLKRYFPISIAFLLEEPRGSALILDFAIGESFKIMLAVTVPLLELKPLKVSSFIIFYDLSIINIGGAS